MLTIISKNNIANPLQNPSKLACNSLQPRKTMLTIISENKTKSLQNLKLAGTQKEHL